MTERTRVMVVEDESTIRQLMAEILREDGHEVVECSSGEDALACLDAVSPSVITLDLAMPSMDGIEFLRALRQHPNGRDVAVVVVTAAPEFLREELWEEGHWVLAKPFHMEQLLQMVNLAHDRNKTHA